MPVSTRICIFEKLSVVIGVDIRPWKGSCRICLNAKKVFLVWNLHPLQVLLAQKAETREGGLRTYAIFARMRQRLQVHHSRYDLESHVARPSATIRTVLGLMTLQRAKHGPLRKVVHIRFAINSRPLKNKKGQAQRLTGE